MSSEKKIEANRLNAQKSTGPKTEEGKRTVSLNAVVHGLRARSAVLLVKDPDEFNTIANNLYLEWQPWSATEAGLIEQMAVCQWRLGRMEAVNSTASLQSDVVHLSFHHPNRYLNSRGKVRYPDVVDKGEMDVQRTLNMLSQQQARLERSFYKAMETLQRLQQGRERNLAEPAPLERTPEEKPKVMVAGATAGAPVAAPDAWLPTNPQTGKVRRWFGQAWIHKSGLPEGILDES